MPAPILKLDARGRILVLSTVLKAGVTPAGYYQTSVAEDGTITLEPVTTRRLVES